MPKLLGMEPETVHKLKTPLLIGGGGLLLFLILKGRGTPQVAAEAPSGAAPVLGVGSPAANPELAQSGGIVSALQQQMQGQQFQQDAAAANLELQSRQQDLVFKGQQQEYQIARQKQVDLQQDAVTREQYKQLKNQGKTGGFFGDIFRSIGQGIGLYGQLQGAGIVAKPPLTPAQPTQHVGTVPFYPTPTGTKP